MDVLPYKIHSNSDSLKKRGLEVQPKASILMAFYNNIPFLEIILASAENQTFKDFELIICDDGSRPDVVARIHELMKSSKVLIRHMWHEDKGFRKVEMLNKALLNSHSSYMIFIDQDCIMHPEFVREHYENREKSTALSGRRVELSPFLTKFINPERIRRGWLQRVYGLFYFFLFFRKDNQWDKGVYIKNKTLRRFFNRKYRALVGCNYSIHKADLIAVNGFDMRYTTSGTAEDCDIEFRLLQNNIKLKPVCHAAVQYHMFHKIRPPDYSCVHFFEENKRNKTILAPKGYDLITATYETQL